VGGWLKSEKREGAVLEWGPNTLMASPEWFDLFRMLGLKPQLPRPQSKHRFIILNDRLQKLPGGPLSFLFTSAISWSSKSLILADFFRREIPSEDDMSLHDFALRYLNQEILDRLLQPFVSGVHAGDVKELSLKSCFPRLWAGLQAEGSVLRGLRAQSRGGSRSQMVTFAGGLEDIVKALAHELGARIHLETKVEALAKQPGGNWLVKTRFGEEAFDQIVLASPAFEAARLLESLIPHTQRQTLVEIPYQRVMVWNLICEKTSAFPKGFGCLVPRTEGTALLGSLWRSQIFDAAAEPNRVTLSQFFSGTQIPEDLNQYEAQIRRWFPGLGRSLLSETRTYERGIPQLLLGHQQKMDEVIRTLPPGVSLVGNYIDGVGLLAVMSRVRSALAPLLDNLA